MKLIDTLSGYDKQFMLQGGHISFMKGMIRPQDSFYDETTRADRAYFLRSGNKTISPIYEELLNSEYDVPKFLPFGVSFPNATDYISTYDYEFIKLNLPNKKYVALFNCYDGEKNFIRVISFHQSTTAEYINFLAEGTEFITIRIRYGDKFLDYNELNKSNFVQLYLFDFESAISDIVRHKYLTKWEEVYRALSTVVNPQDDYSIKKALSNTNTNTKSKTDKTEYGSNDMLSFIDRKDSRKISDTSNTTNNLTDDKTISHNITKEFEDRKDTESTQISKKHEVDFWNKNNEKTYNGYKEIIQSNGEDRITEKTVVNNNNSNQDYSWGFNSQTGVATDKTISNDNITTTKNGDENYTERSEGSEKQINGSITDTLGESGSEKWTDTIGKDTTYNGKEKTTNNEKESRTFNSSVSDLTTKDDVLTYDGSEKHAKTGTDTQTITESNSNTNEQNVDEHGFKNNPTDNLQKALDFRLKNIFFDIIYSDIDSIVTIPIYL